MKKTSLILIVLSISLLTCAQSSGDLENQFYFRFGYSNPTKSYLGVDDISLWDYVTRGGGIIEFGQIFILNSIPLSDGLRLGINADYAEISYHQLNAKPDDSAIGVFKIASKIGSSISYSPITDLVFDAFVKAKIPWVAGLALVSGDSDGYDEGYGGILGFGFSTGINVRYRVFMVGFEFNKDWMNLENIDVPGSYFGTFGGKDDDKTPMPSCSFTFGFSF